MAYKRAGFDECWRELIVRMGMDKKEDLVIVHDRVKLIYRLDDYSKAMSEMALDLDGHQRVVVHANMSELKRMMKANQLDIFRKDQNVDKTPGI